MSNARGSVLWGAATGLGGLAISIHYRELLFGYADKLASGLVQLPSFDIGALEAELRSQVQGEVRFDKITRGLYSTDASIYKILPAGVVVPKTREDIVRALAICRKFRCPITMRGGGTSQAGQAIGEGIQIDTSKYYNRLLEVNVEERWARVEPGIVLDELNAQLASSGLRFAPDISTASRATLGGMMANNSAGARSVVYGKTIDHVLEQTVLLSDGSIAHFQEIPRSEIPQGRTLETQCYQTVLRLAETHREEIGRRYPKVLRRVGGYNLDEFTDPTRPVNLAKILVGSEGTLGIVLEAKVRLAPLPKAKAVMVIGFRDLLESLSATPLILRHGPSAVEVMDKSILNFTRQNDTLNRIRAEYVEGDPGSTLTVEFYADRQEDLPPRLAALEADLRANGLGYFYKAETVLAAQARIWSLRESALGLSTAMKGDAKSISFVEDTAVAPERLSEYIGEFLKIIAKYETTAGVYAHASVGCLHVRPVINLKTAQGIATFESIANDVADLVLKYGGALSGEHGDGLVRGPFMRRMFGDALYDAFREIKRTFDPDNLLNPGKIVDCPPITSNLRFGTGYETSAPATYFNYSAYGGLAGAVEMCSGVGACRKKLSGTMCPSYMATRDESASTRGRANALRMAMAGELGSAGLTDEGVLETLDLCLECRACKAECPVGVDMARFKSEFLAAYWARHGVPLRARLLGNIASLAPWASSFAALANRGGRWGWLREVLGVAEQRSLPQWKQSTFLSEAGGGSGDVTLFADTFTNHYDPEIGLDALRVLKAGGVSVRVARPGCCGRPLISQGLLAEARQSAETLVDGLHSAARNGKILFLEPSCLSAVKDDAVALVSAEYRERAAIVADASMLFDEFAAGLDLPLRTGPGKILLHGHCHQKSLGLLDASKKLLAKIPGATIIDLDAGCCGMAGSFGYAREHYDVSVAIANRKLIPAAKSMKQGEVLVAPGTSCRHQVHDLAQVGALHPATLLASLLADI